MAQHLQVDPEVGASSVAEDERLVVLQRSPLLDWRRAPECDRWTVALRRETGAAVAAVVLVDATRLVVTSLSTVSGSAPDATELPLSTPLAEYLMGQTDLSTIAAPAGYAQTEIVVDGQLLGWMVVADSSRREWSEGDLQTVDDAATAVATEMSLRLAHEAAARARVLVASHNRLHELIAQAAPLSDVLGELVAGIERYEPSVIPCVVLLDRETNTLHPGAARSLPAHYFAAIDGVVIGPNIGACGSAAWSGQLTITDDIAHDPRWAPIRDFAIDAGLRHCWSMPIKAPDDEVLGTLALYGPQPRHPLPEHLALMRDGAQLAGIAIERQRTMQALIHDARHDGLTGLPNRAAVFAYLKDALADIAPGSKVAVLFVDLDGLKALNDTLGHDRADEMIRQIGQRLSATVAQGELVGRFGGDEFVVIAQRVAEDGEAADLGCRLLDAISEPLLGIESTILTASVGIAMVASAGIDGREAIRQADSAMYRAKRAGGGGCSFFEGSRRPHTGRRQLLARNLHAAEMREEMQLVFQPVFELAGSGIIAVESLVRWTGSPFGEVSPNEFIPLAEDSGTIASLGAWVLRESCETVARIMELTGRSVELAVNVSARQLARPSFVKTVDQTLAHAEFPVELLTLEVAETALMGLDPATTRTMRELQSLGLRIVLDDFGTGCSSLSWLKHHPLQGIKIDRSFVKGLPGDVADRAIVAAVVGIAGAIGCPVTAEGVETQPQLDAVRALNCDRAQGYLLAHPGTADELAARLRSSP